MRWRSHRRAIPRPLLGEWFELIGVGREGNEIPIEMTTWVVRVGDSRQRRSLGAQHAARRDLESAVSTSERLQSLMDATPDVCIFTDTDGTIRYVSPSCATTLGHDPESLVGTLEHEIVHPEDRRQYAEMRTVAMSAGGPTTKLLRIPSQVGRLHLDGDDGVRGPWSSGGRADRVRDDRPGCDPPAGGRRPTASGWSRGSEPRTGDLLDSLRREQRMVRELGDLNRLKDDFVSTVSHELRGPLTSIIGYAEILGDGDLGALVGDQHRVLDVMDQNARRLLTLVEDLLTIGRIEAGAFRCEPRRSSSVL